LVLILLSLTALGTPCGDIDTLLLGVAVLLEGIVDVLTLLEDAVLCWLCFCAVIVVVVIITELPVLEDIAEEDALLTLTELALLLCMLSKYIHS
jgi:uncharacterized membrane protein HdeD (DUF308 family)